MLARIDIPGMASRLRRGFIGALSVTGLLCAQLCGVASAAVQIPQAVLSAQFPDPDILPLGVAFYAYSTNVGAYHVPMRVSLGTMDGPWAESGDAMPTLPPWVGPNPGNHSNNVWAPDVSMNGYGQFIMYFTANNKSTNHQCIGTATSLLPGGPFTSSASGPLICDPHASEDIDPATFTDLDGKHYLAYKTTVAGKSRINVVGVSADGLHFVGSPRTALSADRPEERGVIEAPTLIRRGATYYLFYSAAPYNSGHYFVNYATAKSPTGPFSKARPMTFMDGNTFGMKLTNTGGQDIVPTVLGDRMVFHANTAIGRQMYVKPINWTNGTPTLG